jgi:formylglycine-generating enzyme required for sulfatase activity
MKRHSLIIGMALLAFLLLTPTLHATQRGIRLKARTVTGTTKEIALYSGYHALVIGCGEYTKGWPQLPNPIRDAIDVKNALEKLGFEVKIVPNPDGQQLRRALNGLVSGEGRDPTKAIFVFFAGHGHTLTRADGTKLGYIVPVDAPDPAENLTGFMTKAMSMREIEELSTLIKAKHVLMAFDSCFSGALFRSSPGLPSRYIQEQVANPVRAFITAGDENERVPDESVFKTCLIQGLVDGHADRNSDGYVTGEELGLYLKEEVVNYTQGAQHPYFGKIRNPKLDKGDFIFHLASSAATVQKPSRKEAISTLSVEANVSGARVLVDGHEIGSTPLTDRDVSPGEHRIRVEKQGYESYHKRVVFEPGRSMSMYVDLSKTVPKKARIFVDTEPHDAEVRITNIDQNFYQGIELEPGRYQVEVAADNYEKKSLWVSLDAGEDKSLTIVLKRLAAAEGGKTFTNSIGMKFVLIPSGTFTMGSPSSENGRGNDETQHRVRLTKAFYLQTTEVTQGQWYAVMGTRPWSGMEYVRDRCSDCAASYISWDDAQRFIKKLNEKEGTNKYRLPTEAEWEYACRAGSTTMFCFGNSESILGEYAWYIYNVFFDSREKYPHTIAQKKPNTWGLYDMHGNLDEWCQGWYEKNYPTGDITDPTGPSSGTSRVLRGGSWRNPARFCRSASRGGVNPDVRNSRFGFRLAGDF